MESWKEGTDLPDQLSALFWNPDFSVVCSLIGPTGTFLRMKLWRAGPIQSPLRSALRQIALRFTIYALTRCVRAKKCLSLGSILSDD